MELLLCKEEKKSSLKKEKNYFLTDVETCDNSRVIMEWSFMIINDLMGKTQEYCYIIKEVWENETYRNGIYAKNKLAHWQEMIDSGKAKIISIYKLYDIVNKLIEEKNVNLFCAYNASFDYSAIQKTYHRYGIDKRLDYETSNKILGLEKFCLWNYAKKLFRTKEYVKWAMANGIETDKKNIQTSAEAVYKYLTENTCFAESHYGIEDLQIEYSIFLASAFRNTLDRNNALELNKNGHWSYIKKYQQELAEKGVI